MSKSIETNVKKYQKIKIVVFNTANKYHLIISIA